MNTFTFRDAREVRLNIFYNYFFYIYTQLLEADTSQSTYNHMQKHQYVSVCACSHTYYLRCFARLEHKYIPHMF